MTDSAPLYFDYNATTPVLPEVIEVMVRALREGWGNPGSDHAYGRRARAMVDEARAHLARLLGAAPSEIVFVSGGTEACDLALQGGAAALAAQTSAPATIVTSSIEHPAVAEACEALARAGWSLQTLPVGRDGRVQLPETLPADTRLLTIMLANNETGVLQPVRELSALARAGAGPVLVHTDASQAVGKIPVDVNELGVDLLTVAGHKLYAPKGIGALYVRAGVTLQPRLRGGGQQQGLRAGTEPVPAIAALGEAARVACETLAQEGERQRTLREALAARLCAAVPGLAVTGEEVARLPGTLHVRFPGVLGREVLAGTAVAASTGAACHSGVDHPSRVLLAMGIAPQDALGAVRLSLGRSTTEADVERAVDELAAGWRRARRQGSQAAGSQAGPSAGGQG